LVWLARITERGMICSSFVPPEPIRRLRTHTRYRRHLTQARTAEKQRAEKLLEDGHLELSSVISDIHRVSGRDMLNAIAAGQRDPKALAQLARGTMRGKIRRLEEALDCSFSPMSTPACSSVMLATIDHYSAQIGQLTGKIEALIAPYLHQVEQLDGIGQVCAQDIIAEIGTDMTVFPTASHLVSWAKWSPQVRQSAGKRKGSNATGRGNPYLGAALGEATISTARTQSFLGAKYRRLARRMPKKKALVATGNSMLTTIHALLSDPAASYQDLGAGYYEQRTHARRQAAIMSRASNASATRSPSRPSTPPPANSTPQPAKPPPSPLTQSPAALACRLPGGGPILGPGGCRRGLIFGPGGCMPACACRSTVSPIGTHLLRGDG
jgi:transposase